MRSEADHLAIPVAIDLCRRGMDTGVQPSGDARAIHINLIV